MVQAILEGRKTQTRRTKGLDFINLFPNHYELNGIGMKNVRSIERMEFKSFYILKNKMSEQIVNVDFPYEIDDIIWVRENFYTQENFNHWSIAQIFHCKVEIFYTADIPYYNIKRPLNRGKNRPSIHMPKEAARIFLKVTNIRFEQLNDITEADSIAEGVYENPLFGHNCYLCGKKGHVGTPNCEDGFFHTAKDSFFSLWESINGKQSLESNPWVWVIEFERVEKPENF
jgi:hypothetical protein